MNDSAVLRLRLGAVLSLRIAAAPRKVRFVRSAAAIRAQVEAALGPGFLSPFELRPLARPAAAPCGIPEIDSLTGGLPRGSLTEIIGAPSSGRSSLMLSVLAAATARGEMGALVDARDSLDSASALAAGVALDRLLWVRCRSLEQAIRATDLLLAGGGFGAVTLDLADVPPAAARRVPLSVWFRMRRVVENTPTVLALVERESNAQSCASLVLQLSLDQVCWSTASATGGARNPKLEARDAKFACLLQGACLKTEVIRDRNSKAGHSIMLPSSDEEGIQGWC